MKDRVLVELLARLVVTDATTRSAISAMMLSTRIRITRAAFFLLLTRRLFVGIDLYFISIQEQVHQRLSTRSKLYGSVLRLFQKQSRLLPVHWI